MKLFITKLKLLPTLSVFLGVSLLMSLGFWQLHRADYKRQLQAQYQQRSQQSPVPFEQLSQFTDSTYYPVKISGHFDNQHQFLLDNQFYQHQAGYDVITPLLPDKGGPAVLINRGWIAAGTDRQQLPQLPMIEQPVNLLGIIQPVSKPFLLGSKLEIPKNTAWPRRIQLLDTKLLATQLGYPVAGQIVQLNRVSPYRFAPLWQPINTKAYIHTAYAFQWFCLAATLLICYVVVQVKRAKKV